MNKFDLNLLKVLEILLQERNVSAAAKRLNLSQSAVSKHLARLREMFSDKLFERNAQGLKATPRAIELAPELRSVIQQLEQLTRPTLFNPELSSRKFRIHLADTACSLTFPSFMPDLLSQAPNITLKTSTWDEDSLNQLLKCEVDLGIACREWDQRSPLHIKHIPKELSYTELLQEHSLCLVRKNHPALKQTWDLETFLQYRHLQVTIGGKPDWLLDEVLNSENLYRDIAIDMPDFHSAMSLCEQSDLILCAPARYVAQMAGYFDLAVLDIPVSFEDGAYVLLWHKHFEHDNGHRWLRELIVDNVTRDDFHLSKTSEIIGNNN